MTLRPPRTVLAFALTFGCALAVFTLPRFAWNTIQAAGRQQPAAAPATAPGPSAPPPAPPPFAGSTTRAAGGQRPPAAPPAAQAPSAPPPAPPPPPPRTAGQRLTG